MNNFFNNILLIIIIMKNKTCYTNSYQELTDMTNLLDDSETIPNSLETVPDSLETVSDQSQSDSSETQICKYCNETGSKMVKPCQCNDYVHYTCLDKWQRSRQNNKDKCEICQTQFYSNSTFNYRKCVTDFLIHICIVSLNIFIMVGCTGYDIIHKYILIDDAESPFYEFLSAMFGLGIVFSVISLLGYIVAVNDKNIPQKYIYCSFVFHIAVQIIPVIICSSILGTFFWNITTFGMGITIVIAIFLAIFILCIILVIGALIFQNLIQSLKLKYGEVQFNDNQTVTV